MNNIQFFKIYREYLKDNSIGLGYYPVILIVNSRIMGYYLAILPDNTLQSTDNTCNQMLSSSYIPDLFLAISLA